MFWARYLFDFRRVFWRRSFRAFKKLHFLVSITSETFKLCSSSFFWKCSKFHVDFKKAIKVGHNVLGLLDNFVRTSWVKIFLLRQEYMWSPVNLLKGSPKIPDLTKRDLSVLHLSQINGKIGYIYWRYTFEQCFGPVNSLTSKGYSEAGAFGDSWNHILRCQ